MFSLLVLVNLLLRLVNGFSEEDHGSVADHFGTNLLISSMKVDANLDLPLDEEYEDLRAELLAYHTGLASLTSDSKRRSMMSTPCWNLGGICVDYKLCTGFRYLTEVPGCKDRLNVCCFAWNRYEVSDWRHKGIGTLALPWSEHKKFGGRGVINAAEKRKKKRRRPKPTKRPIIHTDKEHSSSEFKNTAVIVQADP